jgi:hypothetical protein
LIQVVDELEIVYAECIDVIDSDDEDDEDEDDDDDNNGNDNADGKKTSKTLTKEKKYNPMCHGKKSVFVCLDFSVCICVSVSVCIYINWQQLAAYVVSKKKNSFH